MFDEMEKSGLIKADKSRFSKIEESVLSELINPVFSKLRNPVFSKLRDPVFSKLRNPFFSKLRNPVFSKLRVVSPSKFRNLFCQATRDARDSAPCSVSNPQGLPPRHHPSLTLHPLIRQIKPNSLTRIAGAVFSLLLDCRWAILNVHTYARSTYMCWSALVSEPAFCEHQSMHKSKGTKDWLGDLWVSPFAEPSNFFHNLAK